MPILGKIDDVSHAPRRHLVRDNGPVTNVNYPLDPDDVLISKTDTHSHITYANGRFIDVSGFDFKELLGSPHNIVRHPDMPEVVFKDMWDTLKSGRFWSGLVKNRRKNGDHYWVRANVVPLSEGGAVKGYASIRVKPNDDEVRMAEEVYRDIRQGKGRYMVWRGMWYRRGLFSRLRRINFHSVGTRIGGISILTLVMLGITGLGGGYLIHQQAADVERLQLRSQAYSLERHLLQNERAMDAAVEAESRYEARTAAESLAENTRELEIAWGALQEALDAYDVLYSDELEEQLDNVINVVTAAVHTHLQDGRFEEARSVFEGFENQQSPRLNSELEALHAGLAEWSSQQKIDMPIEERKLALAFGLIALLGGLLVAVLGWRMARYIRVSLFKANDFALQVAAGNLKSNMPETGRDEVGQTLHSLNFMRKSLSFLIGEVNQRVRVVRPSVNELTESNLSMSSRIEQQASAVQETAASTEEISSTVSQSAENSKLASKASVGNVKEVDDASRIMHSLGESMGDITQQAENMASIVGTIDSIAFQTNILALNASVEAARAGEHGRGFAVVAQEVRKLASQSADAAKKVQDLIQSARDGISNGEKHATDAEHAMERIRLASQRVNDLMGEISAATTEQNEGIGQISQAISEIDQSTQESSVAMHTYNASTESLRQEILALSHSAQAFLSEADAANVANEHPLMKETLSEPAIDEHKGSKSRKNYRVTPVVEDQWESF